MNLLRAICCIILFTGVADSLSIGCSKDAVVESFYYPDDRSAENTGAPTEYLIITRKVSWMDANTLCPSYGGSEAQQLSPQVTRSFNEVEENTEGQDAGDEGGKKYNTTLAIFSSDEERNWLARMLSESNYRYEGLWIGGTRKNKTSDWHWIGDRKLENNILSNSLIYENYPSWYKVDEELTAEQNCLLFNKIGHDVPVFIPENCHLPRPFVCIRNGKKKPETLISAAGSVSIDGYRYTLYRVTTDDDDKDCQDTGIRKLNGGGVTWKRAQFECRKRGQHLAMVLTNEAASAIADLMLKNRPSMENAWLGGRSADGSQWTWVTSGSSLSTTKSASTEYPPWLEGHPIPVPKNHHSYTKRERCLILDRHLCPEQIAPVFLDLDCDKERPFICQDGFGETQGQKSARRAMSDNDMFDFSESKMTFQEGEKYCGERKSQIANVLDPKSLSAALDKMSELSIDHVWIGGRTMQIGDEWQWVDLAGNPLSAKDVGANAAWCFGDNSTFLPKAEPNVCLNLDYEARGFPLLYGLPCNASQVVLCGGESDSAASQIVPAEPEDVDTRLSFNVSDKANATSKNKTLDDVKPTVLVDEVNSTTVQTPIAEVNGTKAKEFQSDVTMPENIGTRLTFNVTEKSDAASKNKILDARPTTVKVDEVNDTTVQTPIAEVNGAKDKGFQSGTVMPEDVGIRLTFNVTEKGGATSKNKTLDVKPTTVKVDEVNNSTTVPTLIAEVNGTKAKGFQNGPAMPEDAGTRLLFNVTEKGDATRKNETLDMKPTTVKVDEVNNSTTVQTPVAEVNGSKAKGFQNGTTIPMPLESTSSRH